MPKQNKKTQISVLNYSLVTFKGVTLWQGHVRLVDFVCDIRTTISSVYEPAAVHRKVAMERCHDVDAIKTSHLVK